MTSTPTYLIVPGLREHVQAHWQTWLAEQLPRSVTVPPLERNQLSCQARLDAIDETLSGIDGPVVIVAHSAGCMMVTRSAERSTRPIQAALLAAPADVETQMPAGYPTLEELIRHGWTPIPRKRLRFPSLLAAGSNDPLTSLERARRFAHDWGSRLVELGPVGHLNPHSGHGPWPEALRLITELECLPRTNGEPHAATVSA